MQPNLIGVESLPHRARFAWLGLALATTIALLVAAPRSGAFDARAGERALEPRAQKTELRTQHRCGRVWSAAERAERRAAREAMRAEHAARRAAERAERRARRAD